VANTNAVAGLNYATGLNNVGVYGYAATGTGVYGAAAAPNRYAVIGATYANGGYGLTGVVASGVTGAIAFLGGAPAGNYAAVFNGDVVVNGSFTVVNPVNKHGAIKHPDGSYRLLYSVESPESWLEDFGTGVLTNGKAEISLDPDFAAVVQPGEYHAFAMARDAGCKGLAISAQSASGFVVQELNGGVSNGAFSYRVVAKPRSEEKVTRLGKVVLPQGQMPDLLELPKQSAVSPPLPAPPARPSAPTGVAPAVPAAPAAGQGSGTTQGSTTSAVQPAPPPRP
jgi:hypothetical protein